MTRIIRAAVFVCALALSITAANANPLCLTNDGRYGNCVTKRATDASGNRVNATIIGGRPAGCPRRYCGCGLRLYLGLEDKRLNLASNWIRLFPRTSLRSGVVAARSGHAFYVEDVIDAHRGIVLARDYNSGGGLSRIHVRSTRGFVFVNPNRKMVAR